jgi:transposase
MTRRTGYKRYSAEFKRAALKRASKDGTTDKVVCEKLGISARQLARWRDELRLLGDDAFLGKKARSAGEEVTRLKRELAEVKRERDFLKVAEVFFATESK